MTCYLFFSNISLVRALVRPRAGNHTKTPQLSHCPNRWVISFCLKVFSDRLYTVVPQGIDWTVPEEAKQSGCNQSVAYLGFRRGRARRRGGGVREEGSGEGVVPLPRKKSFLCPQNNNFWCIFYAVFWSLYRCNNKVQNPFSVPHDLLRVFEDDNTTYYYTLN